MTDSLTVILPTVFDSLFDFAESDEFWDNIAIAFGTEYDVTKITDIHTQWQNREFSQLPEIEVINDTILGDFWGGYAVNSNQIYLADSFVETASSDAMLSVLLEEIEHFIDAEVNEGDTDYINDSILNIGTATLTDNIITDNNVIEHSDITENSDDLILDNNTISNNSKRIIENLGSATLINNTISNNSSRIIGNLGTASLTNNVITDNNLSYGSSLITNSGGASHFRNSITQSHDRQRFQLFLND